jgi:hypothetical protein
MKLGVLEKKKGKKKDQKSAMNCEESAYSHLQV